MKEGYVPFTPQKEGAWVGICRDGRLLAATLLLALLSSSFTAMSLYQLAALQADLMSLRMELQSYRGSATPAAAGTPGLTAGVKVSSPLLCQCRSLRYATPLLSSNDWLPLFLAPNAGSSSTPQLQQRPQEQTRFPGIGGNRYVWGAAVRSWGCAARTCSRPARPQCVKRFVWLSSKCNKLRGVHCPTLSRVCGQEDVCGDKRTRVHISLTLRVCERIKQQSASCHRSHVTTCLPVKKPLPSVYRFPISHVPAKFRCGQTLHYGGLLIFFNTRTHAHTVRQVQNTQKWQRL